MPCPLFLPAAPLGDFYGGTCAADSGALIPIDTLRIFCNRGYARHQCERAAAIPVDASSFLVKSHSGGTVEIAWATETNHHPVAVGALSLSTQTGPLASGDPMERQAAACLQTYLRGTGQL